MTPLNLPTPAAETITGLNDLIEKIERLIRVAMLYVPASNDPRGMISRLAKAHQIMHDVRLEMEVQLRRDDA